MTIYAGLDLLTIPPNAVTQWGSSTTRPTIGNTNPNGNVVVTTTTALPRGTRTLTWNCTTRAELTAITAFLDLRLGQLVECWIPTYQEDIEILLVAPFFGTQVRGDLASALIVTTDAWRYWYARTSGGAFWSTFYWDQSVDQLDGTFVWNTSPGSGPANVGTVVNPFSVATVNGFLVSRLLRCRMASDSYHVRHLGKASVVTADFVEVVP